MKGRSLYQLYPENLQPPYHLVYQLCQLVGKGIQLGSKCFLPFFLFFHLLFPLHLFCSIFNSFQDLLGVSAYLDEILPVQRGRRQVAPLCVSTERTRHRVAASALAFLLLTSHSAFPAAGFFPCPSTVFPYNHLWFPFKAIFYCDVLIIANLRHPAGTYILSWLVAAFVPKDSCGIHPMP